MDRYWRIQLWSHYSIIPSPVILPLASVTYNLLVSSKHTNKHALSEKKIPSHWALGWAIQIPIFGDMDNMEEDDLDTKCFWFCQTQNWMWDLVNQSQPWFTHFKFGKKNSLWTDLSLVGNVWNEIWIWIIKSSSITEVFYKSGPNSSFCPSLFHPRMWHLVPTSVSFFSKSRWPRLPSRSW